MNTITERVIEKVKNIPINEDYLIKKSRDNRYVIKISKNKKEVYIGSKYSANRDVSNLINKYENINFESIIIIFGLGTGEYIYEMLKVFKEYKKIIVIEPDINVIRSFLTLSNSKDILSNDKFFLCLFDKKNLKTSLQSIITQYDIYNLNVESYANYIDLYGTELQSTIEILREIIIALTINRNTLLNFSNAWYECYLRNLIKMFESTPINCIHNTQVNKPAIIVSAGPSLEKNIELLKNVQDNFIIITGGRTLKTLLNIGIKPDLLCIVDAGLPSYQLVEDNLQCDVPLMFFELTNSDVVDKYAGKKVFFNFSDITGKILGINVDSIYTGGSVAHVCTSAAVYMGCNPIIFIGQDFAYTGEKLHAPSAELGVESYNEVAASNDLFVDDIYGNKVRTSLVLDMFKKQMEFFIKLTSEREFINSTEGGADIHNTKVMDLKDAIKIYGKNKLDHSISSYIYSNIDFDIKNIISILETSNTRLKNIKLHAKKGLKHANKILLYYSGKNSISLKKILREMDELDSYINNEIHEVDFINYLLYPIFNNLFTKTYRALKYESVIDKGKRIAEKNIFMYSGISNAIDEALPLIEKIISELKNR